ncbi:MAG: ArsC family transcriptional regulator [Treponema sp.]|nr:MAG: ArsC family transcriptional regulator [Treponema sp.]
MKFIYYPKCTTCKRAHKWLQEQGVKFSERDIVEKNPSLKELKSWHKKSGLPLKRFFNTSGVLYRELGLKDKLAEMTDEQQYELLATDGKLVKRPILVTKSAVLTGFKEADWKIAVDEDNKATK